MSTAAEEAAQLSEPEVPALPETPAPPPETPAGSGGAETLIDEEGPLDPVQPEEPLPEGPAADEPAAGEPEAGEAAEEASAGEQAEVAAGTGTPLAAAMPQAAAVDAGRASQAFLLDGLDPGDYWLSLAKPGCLPQHLLLSLRESRDLGPLPLYIRGDVNFDGQRSADDALQILRYTAPLPSLLTPEDAARLQSADANGDGTVDRRDAALLQRWSIGLGKTE